MPHSSDPDALLRHARQDLAEDRLDAAQDKVLRVLSAHRHDPGALELLGEILVRQAREADAVRVFNALTLMQPAVARHWQNLGTALRASRQYPQALAAFERALRLAPPTPDLLYNLGALHMSCSNYAAAHLALRDAAALAPANARIRWAYAQCCYDLGRTDEAGEALAGWQQLQNLDVEMATLIVLLLVTMGRLGEAQGAVERLLAAPPAAGRGAVALATILERLHRLDEARAVMRRVDDDPTLRSDPERLLLAATLDSRAGRHEESIEHLSRALEAQADPAHRHHVLFPLAKAADAAGRYEEAFAAAAAAHRSQRAFLEGLLGRSSVEESQIYTLTAAGCDPQDVARWLREPAPGSSTDIDVGGAVAKAPSPTPSPIFIVGFPRSGTTLLEQVLDAHPLLRSMDEQPFLLRAATEVGESGVQYPSELGHLDGAALQAILSHYWEGVRSRVTLGAGQRLVDKNPLNLILMPLIRRLFPDSPIIVTVRHPFDTLLSCFLQHFRAPGLAIVCRDLPTLARAYDRAFGYWYSQWPLLRPASLELRYEALATDLPAQARRLCEFLALPWHAAMLAPAEHARAKGFIATPSYAQVIQPVSDRSFHRWRHYRRHFEEVRPTLEPWLERWGYSAE